MKIYRIASWDRHFENNRTRELKRLEWIPVPNKHDGDGFTELMDHEQGIAHFGAWVLLLQVASKCDPRGTLVRDGADGAKIPHDAGSIARVTRGDKSTIHAAINRLISIGWVESYEDSRQNPAPSCDNPAPECGKVPMEWNGMELNGMEHSSCPPADAVDVASVCKTISEFDQFWESYPRKTGKKAAMRSWSKAKDKPDIGKILASIESQSKSDQWTRDNGQYIPHPATWLNQGRWDDQLPQAETETEQRPKLWELKTRYEAAQASLQRAIDNNAPGDLIKKVRTIKNKLEVSIRDYAG